MVLGFPCNQFHDKTPESNDKIAEFCRYNYGVTFPMLAQNECERALDRTLFRYLTKRPRFRSGFDPDHPLTEKLQEILSSEDPHYSRELRDQMEFTKFVIDREGESPHDTSQPQVCGKSNPASKSCSDLPRTSYRKTSAREVIRADVWICGIIQRTGRHPCQHSRRCSPARPQCGAIGCTLQPDPCGTARRS